VRVAQNVHKRRRHDGSWVFEATFRDCDGRQHTKKLAAMTERAAVREARSLLAQRDRGERVIALAQYLESFVQEVYFPLLDGLVASGLRAERGVDLYRERWRLHLSPRLGHRRIGDIQAHHIADVIHSMRRRGYSESTIASALLILRAIYRLATRRGLVPRSPLNGLDPAELPRPCAGGHGRVLDEQGLEALVRHADPMYKPVVTTLAYTGLRLSEALGLRWRDIDFVGAEIGVRGQLSLARKGKPAIVIPTKTHAGVRIVPMLPAVEDALITLLADEQRVGRGGDSDFVFLSRKGTPLHQRNVAVRGVEAAARRAGLGKVTPHDLRRSFCSLSARRGVDPVEAAQMTGHSLSVWMKSYVRSFGKPQRDEARERLLASGLGKVERGQGDQKTTQKAVDSEAVSGVSADIPPTSGDLRPKAA
jgi:integrase